MSFSWLWKVLAALHTLYYACLSVTAVNRISSVQSVYWQNFIYSLTWVWILFMQILRKKSTASLFVVAPLYIFLWQSLSLSFCCCFNESVVCIDPAPFRSSVFLKNITFYISNAVIVHSNVHYQSALQLSDKQWLFFSFGFHSMVKTRELKRAYTN